MAAAGWGYAAAVVVAVGCGCWLEGRHAPAAVMWQWFEFNGSSAVYIYVHKIICMCAFSHSDACISFYLLQYLYHIYTHICSRWQQETSEDLKGPHLRSPASRQGAAHQLLQPAMSRQAVTATQIGPGVDESAVSQAGRASVGRETRGGALATSGGQVKQGRACCSV